MCMGSDCTNVHPCTLHYITSITLHKSNTPLVQMCMGLDFTNVHLCTLHHITQIKHTPSAHVQLCMGSYCTNMHPCILALLVLGPNYLIPGKKNPFSHHVLILVLVLGSWYLTVCALCILAHWHWCCLAPTI